MDWISSLLLATVRLAIPVLLISLAELYGQRAGMVNIGPVSYTHLTLPTKA